MEQRQQLAGRIQAAESTVQEMDMATRVAWLLRELQDDRRRWDERQAETEEDTRKPYVPNVNEALRQTYIKTGVRERGPNSLVCLPIDFCDMLSCGHGVTHTGVFVHYPR